LIADAHRQSTRSVYDNHWRRWSFWCRKHRVDPFSPTEADLVNHLAYLASDLHLSVSTLRVRRSAICRTLSQVGKTQVGSSSWVSDLLKGLAQRQARSPRRTPAWDLGVVLTHLQGSDFEPLQSVSLAQLTVKTAFFVFACFRSEGIGGYRPFGSFL
jgi:hypothetical protein